MNKVVFIDGCRTPFLKAGTDYQDLLSYQLAQFAIKGLIDKTQISNLKIDRVILGNVIANIKTSNVSREAALMAGVDYKTPCNTVVQACISANRAICDAYFEIASGKGDIIIAGGVDSCSDTPIGYKKSMQKKLFNAQKIKGFWATIRFIFSFKISDFFPERPQIAEYISGRTMGVDCDIMAAKWQISREEQDHFAVRSQQLAYKAQQNKILSEEIIPVSFPPEFKTIIHDNIVRSDTSYDAIKFLNPVFDKKFGTLTAANSSQLTDGAACVLLMNEKIAIAHDLNPMSFIVDFQFTGGDISEELLLGPAYAVLQLLIRNKLKFSDIDVFEFHEAFAGQILANLKAISDAEFLKKIFNLNESLGEIPIDKLNIHGGSLALGHPFGATGARLMTTASYRLKREKGKYALIAACAAGAHGHAMILENYNSQ